MLRGFTGWAKDTCPVGRGDSLKGPEQGVPRRPFQFRKFSLGTSPGGPVVKHLPCSYEFEGYEFDPW